MRFSDRSRARCGNTCIDRVRGSDTHERLNADQFRKHLIRRYCTFERLVSMPRPDVLKEIKEAEARNCETVSLSGGVAYNEHIASRIRDRVSSAGLSFITNRRVPPGDGGIAYGQLAVAAAQSSH